MLSVVCLTHTGPARAAKHTHKQVAPAAPSLSLGAAGGGLASTEEHVLLEISTGISFYPKRRGKVVPRINLGMDLDLLMPKEGRTTVDWIPGMRIGLAMLKRDAHPFVRALLPWLSVHGIVGVRMPSDQRPVAMRLGIGVSSPLLVIVSAKAMEAGIPLPNMVELFVDLDPNHHTTAWYIKLGIGI